MYTKFRMYGMPYMIYGIVTELTELTKLRYDGMGFDTHKCHRILMSSGNNEIKRKQLKYRHEIENETHQRNHTYTNEMVEKG